jgi:hypothetical protein
LRSVEDAEQDGGVRVFRGVEHAAEGVGQDGALVRWLESIL